MEIYTQSFLTIICVIIISYYNDFYFVLMILLSQIANTINISYSNEFINDNSSIKYISTAVTMFNFLCFVWSLLFVPKEKLLKLEENLDLLYEK